MDDNAEDKKYGLIIPGKRNFKSAFLSSTVRETKPKIFTENSSDDNLEEEEEEADTGLDWRSRTVAKTTEKSVQRNQARQAALKALEEDPTIFQYDELYDEMQQKKEEKKPAPTDKKPKYIDQLLRSAEQRKLETERRTERKIQKERENEGDEFRDKESFITPAYQAKLEERKQQEAEELLKEQMEAALDVTKQRDLGGFYRHMYNQTFAEKDDKDVKKEVSASFRKDADPKDRRHYRQRREDSPEPEVSEPVAPESIKTEPIEDVEQEQQENEENDKKESPPKREKRAAASASLVSAAAIDRAAAAERNEKAAEKVVEPADSSSDESETSTEDVKETVVVPKVKIDVWKKRTTGQLFDEALQRYQLRKEAREEGLIRWP